MFVTRRRASPLNLYRHLVETNSASIEDSWHRRETLVTHEKRLTILGYPFHLRTNAAGVIALGEISERRFSRCAPVPDAREGQIDLFVTGEGAGDELALLEMEKQFQTVASGSRGVIHLGRWGSIFADWSQPSAFGFIAPALLKHPAVASRHCLDTFMLIALLRNPLGLLHASGLMKDDRAVLLIGPHGTGKSTTALHLIRAGYRLISDTLIFARRAGQPQGTAPTTAQGSHKGLPLPQAGGEEIELSGYGVGELKLAPGDRALFAELPPDTPDLSLDGRRKPIFQLGQLMPERVETAAVAPRSIALCLTRRSPDGQTRLLPLDDDITLYQIIRDTSYLDEPEVMAQNLAVIHGLILRSRNFILELGRDPAEIVRALAVER
ncbi:MAG: hypothetical protein HY259_13205 [Chloroflexi bacterium]|nr:hypothetical protein [Chloroflexota bacterium]MBI3734394.1 hypothetical protein [Chloroflexota bacterium]